MEKEKLVFQKNLDKTKNRVVIPKFFVEKHGYRYYMEIYDDKIILKPVKLKKKGE